jgi:nitrate/TMAO reductase-like tetraheme cytochrome c subunit
MSRIQRWRLAALLLVAALAFGLCIASRPGQVNMRPAIGGDVSDDQGAVAEVDIGWQGEPGRVISDARGRFRLPLTWKSDRIIATKPGFRIASVSGTARPANLRLQRLPTHDNEDYAWIDPHADPAQANNCANCHGEIYREWLGSAHAKSATNPKFLGLFAPDAKTWNARIEHPDGSAVCAKCHAPTLDSPTLEYDIREARGVAKSGIHCDYCHKVADAPTDKLGTRFGRDGLMLLRPAKGDTLTFGPLDDAVRPGESFAFAPVYKESRYCASCHEGIVFGVHAYGTYSEWLASPAKQQGKQCQDCHMAPTGKMTNIAPGKGGIERNPKTLASHHTPGGTLEMLRQCLKMQARTGASGKLDVEITAERVGHRVPTGFVDRQLVLVVEAVDAKGKRVELVEGPRLPKSAGKWSGLPGVLYANQLVGEKERTPTPFWLPVLKSEDTRLLPEKADRRAFLFAAAAERVTVQLWYRRFWQEVADARGWTDNDILVRDVVLNFD